jgi:hypothetical protein
LFQLKDMVEEVIEVLSIKDIVEEVIKVLPSDTEGFTTYKHFRTTVIEEPKRILPNLNYSSGTLRPLDQ